MNYIKCTEELPPCDGYYEISNEPHVICGIAYYDGIGFLYDDIYRPAQYWRKIPQIPKRYGKVEKDL